MTEQRAPLTPAERADLRQKAEEATPGPWEHVPFSDEVIEAADREHTQIATSNDSVADAAYIAAISPDRLLALLDEVERLEQAERIRHESEAKRNAPTPQCHCPAYDAARERGGYPSGICPDCGQWYPGRRGPRGSRKPKGSTP